MALKEVLDFSKQLEKQLGDVFQKAPHLKQEHREIVAKYLPWLIAIAIVLSALVIISLFWLLSVMFSVGFHISILSALLGIPVMLINLYLFATAFKPLQEKKKIGWDKLFLAELLAVVYSVVMVFQWISNMITSLIGVVIGFYILFEIKDQYK